MNVLTGYGLDPKDYLRMKAKMEKTPGVESVDELKSIYLSVYDIKVSGTIKFDNKVIAEYAVRRLERDIARIARNPQEVAALKQLIKKDVDLLFTHTTELVLEN
jgi:hypothetical protein